MEVGMRAQRAVGRQRGMYAFDDSCMARDACTLTPISGSLSSTAGVILYRIYVIVVF